MSLALLLAASLPGPAVPGPLAHSVAFINDARSHGLLGDNLLSLNEAIRLYNRQIQLTDLSPAELAQISGNQDIAWIDLDASITPTITCERDLELITDLPHGLVIGGSYGRPVLDLQGSRGFVADCDFCDFRNMVIRNAAVAVTLTQRNTFYGSVFENVLFDGLTQAGVRVTLPQADGETRLQIESCVFRGLPVAFEVNDTGRDRIGSIRLRDVTIENGGDGFVCRLGPGGAYQVIVERSRFRFLTGTGFALRRPTATDDRDVILDVADLTSSSVAHAFVVEGAATATVDAELRMLDLAANGSSLDFAPVAAATRIKVLDSLLRDSVRLLGSGDVSMHSCRMSAGTLQVGSSMGSLRLEQTALRAVATTTTGAAPLQVAECDLAGGSIAGSASAAVTLDRCWVRSDTTLGSNVNNTAPRPARQLGDSDATPTEPTPGSLVTLLVDLPTDFSGVWLVGLGNDVPTAVQGHRLYMRTSTLVIWPFVQVGRSTVPLPVPSLSALRGQDLVVQCVVGKLPRAAGPEIQLPPGRRLLIR